LNNASVKAPLFPSSMMLFFVVLSPMSYHNSFPRTSYCMNARIPSQGISLSCGQESSPSSFSGGWVGVGVGVWIYLLYAVTIEQSFASQYKLF
jgi:hypothetical protein